MSAFSLTTVILLMSGEEVNDHSNNITEEMATGGVETNENALSLVAAALELLREIFLEDCLLVFSEEIRQCKVIIVQ